MKDLSGRLRKLEELNSGASEEELQKYANFFTLEVVDKDTSGNIIHVGESIPLIKISDIDHLRHRRGKAI